MPELTRAGEVTTAEKVAIGVAIATALGLGTLISLLVGHLLNRREKKVNIAEKAVQVADTMMTRLTESLDRVQEELAVAKRENEELRLELEKTKAATVEESERLRGVERNVHSTDKALSGAQVELSSVRDVLARFPLLRWEHDYQELNSLVEIFTVNTDLMPRLTDSDLSRLTQRPEDDDPPEVPARV
ncbi:hypothetical protein [Plantactinospora sp. WMMB782]|uniref:hypothetical protein n=1 Tax=Plantactinospora sp. WMMB782 TaxID=3404121 RepID=UPI003B964D3B